VSGKPIVTHGCRDLSDAEDSGVAAKLFGASDWIADVNLASHVQVLHRLGIWPGCATIGDPSSGKPFVSEIGDYRSLHFDWGCVQSGMSMVKNSGPSRVRPESRRTTVHQ
jgi:hypothetical protein